MTHRLRQRSHATAAVSLACLAILLLAGCSRPGNGGGSGGEGAFGDRGASSDRGAFGNGAAFGNEGTSGSGGPSVTPRTSASTIAIGTGRLGRVVSGVVRDEHGPVHGAVVRVQTTDVFTVTDADGRFTLAFQGLERPPAITAFAPGYYIGGGVELADDETHVEIELEAHADHDDPTYAWLSAYAGGGVQASADAAAGAAAQEIASHEPPSDDYSASDEHLGEEPPADDSACQNCHSEPGNPDSALPFDEWRRDAHSNSAHNIRFLTMYNGTDVHGNHSPFARFGDSRRFSGIDPLVPDPDQPYYGPGFKVDYPYMAGSCSACHTPAAEFSDTYGADPTTLTGVAAEGVACDLCHKVWDVKLEPETGLPDPDLPGVLSFEFRRPSAGHQFFSGPLDDVAPGEDTYVPVMEESEYCATCHFGRFWDTVVYNSFGEWADSPYSNPKTGRTCQDCHMKPGKATHFALPEKGGLERDPATIFSHLMPGASDEEFLQNAVSMEVKARRGAAPSDKDALPTEVTARRGAAPSGTDALATEVTAGRGSSPSDTETATGSSESSAGTSNADTITVDVKITNDNTGHHVPTDSPLRHLILLVDATTSDGTPLEQIAGPTLPEWCGEGDPAEGYYAGLPGTAYAKVLQELRSMIYPTGAYWNPTRVLLDNRIPALGSDETSYTFVASPDQDVTVNVTLLYRRAYRELADQKGWSDPDIVMEHESIDIPAHTSRDR